MTNEEAIRIIEVAQADCEWNAPLEYQEAFNMAIEALKEQPEHDQNSMSKQPDSETLGAKTGETCEDAISRKAAIDALREAENHAFNSFYKGLVKAHKIIADIPSAQPEPLEGRTVMGDLISRQAAIDVEGLDEEIRCQMCKNQMKTDKGCDGNCKYDEKLYEKIIQILYRRIKSLPSAEPEVIHCKDCKYSKHWYRDKSRCFLWHESGIDVFDDGFCNYAKRSTDE